MKSIETEVVALVERNGRLILQSVGMEQEKGYIQHGAVSCYLHSFFVAYMSVWLAKRFRIRIHLRSLVRGALLHDYFLYDWHQKDSSHRLHGFRHPKTALGNAQRDYHLNWKEKNIIARHMFPLIPVPPQCREAWIVCLADKWCALGETMEPMFHVKHFK